MRVLVGWDDAEEAETIRLYLNVDDSTAVVCRDWTGFVAAAEEEPFGFDIALLSTARQWPRAAHVVALRVRIEPETRAVDSRRRLPASWQPCGPPNEMRAGVWHGVSVVACACRGYCRRS